MEHQTEKQMAKEMGTTIGVIYREYGKENGNYYYTTILGYTTGLCYFGKTWGLYPHITKPEILFLIVAMLAAGKTTVS